MSDEQIVELDLGCEPEAAISGAVLVQTEKSCFLTFNAMRQCPDGLYRDVGTAFVEFIGLEVSKFGYPNDEAWDGIPRTKGLSYGIFEVFNSTWAREITELNRYSFPNAKESRARHFLFLFHDSSFECLADDIRLEIDERAYPEVFARISARVIAE